MSYESWRISYQSSEQAARAAYKQIERLNRHLEWYSQRWELMQKEQKRMREAERTLVCDILANGSLLPDPDGKRYPK